MLRSHLATRSTLRLVTVERIRIMSGRISRESLVATLAALIGASLASDSVAVNQGWGHGQNICRTEK
jgi:hypothetical protein